ncbi:hypothetical protein DPMN_063168 [Dreissena polymorpha]|uniref:Uncharacterized protein n=1 Tax=Dreissena polymorpha TaxID=45954 RepID=A0A9D4CAX6_DREPO|nr:hypothetical protein DPMN_063168 [Dreissena polymorpha]
MVDVVDGAGAVMSVTSDSSSGTFLFREYPKRLPVLLVCKKLKVNIYAAITN